MGDSNQVIDFEENERNIRDTMIRNVNLFRGRSAVVNETNSAIRNSGKWGGCIGDRHVALKKNEHSKDIY